MKLRPLLGLILLLLPAALLAQSYTVTAIRFKTLHELGEAEVLAASALKLGDSVNDAALDKAVERLANTGAFASVAYSYSTLDDKMELEFQVEEMPRPYDCRFDNFIWSSDSELLAYLQSKIPLFHGRTSTNKQALDQILETLDEWLREHGIPASAQLALSKDWQIGHGEAVVFSAANLNISVAKVDLGPTPALTKDERKQLLALLQKGSYSRTYVDELIHRTYWYKGYARAEVAGQKIDVGGSPAAPSVALTMEIAEHLPYKFAGISFEGNTVVSSTELEQAFVKLKGKPLPFDNLFSWTIQLKEFYRRNGFAKCAMWIEPAYDDATATVRYTIHLHEGPYKNPAAH
jgi:outer membrane protein assembly factor BamA